MNYISGIITIVNLTLNNTKKTRFSNTPVHGVVQWLTIASSTTVKFDLDHVKLLKSAVT